MGNLWFIIWLTTLFTCGGVTRQKCVCEEFIIA
jgi:hypothetical protein